MLNGSNWQNAWLNEISKSPFDRTQFSHQKEIYKAGETFNPVIKTPFNLMIKTPVRATASRIRAANSVAVSSTLIMEHLSFIFFFFVLIENASSNNWVPDTHMGHPHGLPFWFLALAWPPLWPSELFEEWIHWWEQSP